MNKSLQLENLLAHLIYDSHQTELLVQLAVLLVCGLFSWALTLLVARWIRTNHSDWQAQRHALKVIGLPLLWLFLTDFGRSLLRQTHEVHLLNLAIPLLMTLVLVQVAARVVRHLTGDSESIRLWGRAIVWIIWLGFALHVTGLFPVVEDMLQDVALVSGKHRFSLLMLLEGLAVVTITVISAMWLARVIENRLMRTTGIDPSLRLVLIKSIRTLLLVAGVLIALPSVGIDITVLSVFGGALGVGLGLGLQKIASNYVSGFIILLDRSIRPGDMITVDNNYGEVSQLNTRYTLLKATDGTEIIMPNETLLTSVVVNHSFSQREVLIKIPVQISYDSDLQHARDIMLGAAQAHPRVLQSAPNAPDTFLTAFADSGINLTLTVWIADLEKGQMNLISDLYMVIWRQFTSAGISFPYPRRDVHLYTEIPPDVVG